MTNKIREAREAAGISVKALAELAGISPPYLSMIERGAGKKRANRDLLARIADALNIPPGALFDAPPVAVAGQVGAGASVDLVDAYEKGGGLYYVAAPPDLPPSGIVAVEVIGESMEPLIEQGDIVFFTRHFMGIDPDAIGHVSIICTDDNRALVKQIRPGRERGTFDLHSVNPTTPPEYGVRLIWAAPWRRHLRRADVVTVEP